MSLEIIVPKQWRVIPRRTLEAELLRIISAKQSVDKTTTGVIGFYNGIVAESRVLSSYLWFRKIGDHSKEPCVNWYELVTIKPKESPATSSEDISGCSDCDSERLLSDDGCCSTCGEEECDL
uniref:Uncharacterized protein n=1 Tax=Microplitis mediator bracovirus TaxID=1836595 RepID=A0A1D5APH2_9VIRU|nr:hypothetical protein A6F54_44 [Microplitis mediator bracovirus]